MTYDVEDDVRVRTQNSDPERDAAVGCMTLARFSCQASEVMKPKLQV